jgi:hypothetical protein
MLGIGDVPNSRRDLLDDVEYPADDRFTIQCLEDRPYISREFWVGVDTAFRRDTNLAKPSELLLHYNYGAAAIKCWGRNAHLLSVPPRRTVSRPSAPVTLGPAGPSRTTHDRTKTIRNRERRADTAESSKRRRGGSEERNVVVEAVDGSTEWDEEDWMQFFLANTKTACERCRVAEEELSSRINKWASDVSHG